jgi:hypothetical protein
MTVKADTLALAPTITAKAAIQARGAVGEGAGTPIESIAGTARPPSADVTSPQHSARRHTVTSGSAAHGHDSGSVCDGTS